MYTMDFLSEINYLILSYLILSYKSLNWQSEIKVSTGFSEQEIQLKPWWNCVPYVMS